MAQTSIQENLGLIIQNTNKKIIRLMSKYEGEHLIKKLDKVRNEILGATSVIEFTGLYPEELKELNELHSHLFTLIEKERNKDILIN